MNRPARLALCLFLPIGAAHAAEPPTREHFAPEGMEAHYHLVHYSPVVKVGDTVRVSGIPAGRGDTYEAKIRNMFEALKAHLATAGASMSDVVEITTYHVQATGSAEFHAEFKRLAPIHHAFFPDHYPAWTAVGVTALLQPGAPVEMSAVAVIGSGRNPKADIAKPERPRP